MRDAIGPTEAARRLGVSPRTVQRWLRDGRLPAVRVGSRLKLDATAGRPPGPIRRLLVANRGEIVVRIARTCRRLGITCLALVTEDQRDAWWARQADETVPLADTYLDIASIVDAARGAGADAVHPGYGFLAEEPKFAAAVLQAGLIWVGPTPDAMRALGDKAAARRLAARIGVPILPGYDGAAQSDARLRREAARLGYPLLLKPSAGGGGKGMHVVREPAALREALASARREAQAAFGDERLVLERYLERPRHVEVQLLADTHGNRIHLGERDCSLQRRHQKVIEEAPAPGVSNALRRRLGEAALALAAAAAYTGAGTAEFLVAEDGSFAFLELNARLQVEHPVTEIVTGLDLVELQLRVAAGERLPLRQGDVRLSGHAVEARLYAEDPWAGFLPSSGTLRALEWPGAEGVRIDAGVGVDDDVGTRYDPLLAKIVAGGRTRAEALDRLDAALGETHALGLTTNRGFLRQLLALPEVRHGSARTDTLALRWHPPATSEENPWVPAAAAVAALHDADGRRRLGFRLNAPPAIAIQIGAEVRAVPLEPGAAQPLRWVAAPDGAVVLDLEGRAVTARLAPPPTVGQAARQARAAESSAATVRAPMPGIVRAMRVGAGETVEEHQVLLVLEAMKMEHAVTASAPGTVVQLHVAPGDVVQRDDPLVELEQAGTAGRDRRATLGG